MRLDIGDVVAPRERNSTPAGPAASGLVTRHVTV